MDVDETRIQVSFDFSEQSKEVDAESTVKKKRSRGRPSTKEQGLGTGINLPTDDELFLKQYYTIGEVAAMLGENQSVVRYWENEFSILNPRKNRKGDRLFRPQDVKNLALIYDLIRNRKYTIEGAKAYLKKNKKSEDIFNAIRSLERIKDFLLELKSQL